MCAWPTRASASARRRRARAISTSPRSSPPPRSPAPTRSIPATASCPRTPLRRDRRGARLHLHRPQPEHIRMMGDKIAAKRRAMRRSAFRWCPAPTAPVTARGMAREAAEAIGYPVLIKAAAGGGGRGMKVAARRGRAARRRCAWRAREAKAAFGDDAVYLEKYLATAAPHRDPGPRRRPRQRRPSRRARLLAAAPPPEGDGGGPLAGPQRRAARRDRRRVAAARCGKLGYRGAGTIEFLYEDGEFLLHRDEHPPAGRASGHRGGHRHRPGARADPHRRRRAAGVRAGRRHASRATPSSAGSTPRTRAPSRPRPA